MKNSLIVNFFAGPSCHIKGQKIVMYDGSLKSVENIEVGDLLMGPDSNPRTVLQLIRGTGPLRQIVPRSGKPFIISENHLLSLRKSKEAKQGPEILNTSVKSLDKMVGWARNTYKLYRVGIELPERELPIPPYILGLWIGDGTRGTVEITTADREIEEEWSKYGKLQGLSPEIRKDDGTTRRIHLSSGDTQKPNLIRQTLNNLGILKNKRIPEEYFQSSLSQRRFLLAGIVDTDGHKGKGETFQISTKWRDLAEDYARLAASVGLHASVGQSMKAATNTEKKEKRPYWCVYISGETYKIPTLLGRKICKRIDKRTNPLNIGFSVNYAGVGDYYGFTVSGDHLYLLDDFTVTHNCGKSTYALGTTYRLKADRWLAEYVPEFAKKLTWVKDFDTLSRQLYVTAKQYRAIYVPYGKVDVVVTDSPFILGLLYPDANGHVDEFFEQWLIRSFNTLNNLNIFLERNPAMHAFQQEGRNQNEAECKAIDDNCRQLLDKHQIPYTTILSGRKDATLDDIMALISARLPGSPLS